MLAIVFQTVSAHAFLAPDNFLGWTLADFGSLLMTLLLALVLRRYQVRMPAAFVCLAEQRWASMVLLFLLPVALRLVLLVHFGVPVPSGADDFGYLLVADTLRHGRLANPPNAFPDAFAQIFVLQQPVYAAMFPLGQGMALALGGALLGHPWAGVLLASGLFCALVYWALCAWMPPAWALAAGLLAVAQFGPLSYWMNCYWGGYLSAIAGCLVVGSIGRLRRDHACWQMSLVLGVGLALQALTRQYETLLLFAAVATTRVFRMRAVVVLPVLAAAALICLQNQAITGHWNRLPYSLYRYDYGIPATFTFQPNPVPHAELNAAQTLDYEAESAVHGNELESLARFSRRLFDRVRFLRFFWSAPLLAATLAAFTAKPKRVLWWPLAAIAVFILGTNFYPYFYPHYIAACACIFLLCAISALRALPRAWATSVLLTCALQFTVWYMLHVSGRTSMYEAWDFVNPNDPQGRLTVQRALDHSRGQKLVFVHESFMHGFAEWVHNSADPEHSETIWVHDLGRDRNAAVLQHYTGREAWLVNVDESPPTLERYTVSQSPFEDIR